MEYKYLSTKGSIPHTLQPVSSGEYTLLMHIDRSISIFILISVLIRLEIKNGTIHAIY